MSGFVLSKSLDPLAWDFGDGVKGVVPEPSPKSVNRFRHRIAENVRATGRDVGDRSDIENLLKVLASLNEDDLNAIYEENLDAVAELCDGSPTREQIASLGHRGFQAFLGWIGAELVNPEGKRPATSS